LQSSDVPGVTSLKLGGLSHNSFFTQALTTMGENLVSLKLETIYFDISIDEIGNLCKNLEELSVINARAAINTNTRATIINNNAVSIKSKQEKPFSKLKLVYLFLVQYTDTQYTALHYILRYASSLESIQVTGTPYLTDSCIGSILKLNPLSRLKRFIMSHPVGQDQPLMVPLTARTVTSLHKSCPDLQCIGDLKYWALTSMQRRKLSFDLGCTLSISK